MALSLAVGLPGNFFHLGDRVVERPERRVYEFLLEAPAEFLARQVFGCLALADGRHTTCSEKGPQPRMCISSSDEVNASVTSKE